MSVYKQNITDAKYEKNIDVLLQTENDVEDYGRSTDDNSNVSGTSRYLREPQRFYVDRNDDRGSYTTFQALCSLEDEMNNDEGATTTKDAAAWKFFDKYLRGSEPLKLADWTYLKQQGDSAGSYLNRHGELISSFDDLVESMPREALDAVVTVQAKPIQDLPPCRGCRDGDSRMEFDAATKEEIVRHNLHRVDRLLSVVPYEPGDDQNLFLGQEGQVTATKVLGDVLTEGNNNATGRAMRVCVAQVNIYSKEESKSAATVTKHGTVVLEGGEGSDDRSDKSPLAALLPWIRLPSFLLPTNGGKVDIQSINFWYCPSESQTNTHYDGHHNLLMILSGKKTVELSPPGAVRGSPVYGEHANHPFLLRCTDVGGHLNYPHFEEDARKYGPLWNVAKNNNIIVSVSAGDALLIPEGWWHRVESSANCVAINVWFDHEQSSLSSIAHDDNRHQLPYQAREMVRRYLDANIEEVHRLRRRCLNVEKLSQLGLGVGGWMQEPGRPIRKLVDIMALGRIFPEEREDEEIANGITVVERYASQLLSVADLEAGHSGQVFPLRFLALPYAIRELGVMISLFITILDPEKQRDRIAMMELFRRFPPLSSHHQRQMFTSLVKSITSGACYVLSTAWEKHGSAAEAEESYNSLFGRCVGDEGRKHFMKEVDEFKNESARRLILGDLMLMNPTPDEIGREFFD